MFHSARAGARAPRATARAGARVTRLGLLLLSAILVACALLSVAAILSEAGAQLGSDSVATTAAAPVSTRPPPMMPQLARQAERQHRTKEQRSASMPQVQRRAPMLRRPSRSMTTRCSRSPSPPLASGGGRRRAPAPLLGLPAACAWPPASPIHFAWPSALTASAARAYRRTCRSGCAESSPRRSCALLAKRASPWPTSRA